ncbi:tRNA (N6-isopentenyl adenosine(37)-C2)-methylthiotransferase MiaB [Collinsella sp. An2]|uniref:tRNA (N6-isopentenyl adenosine(37)-C2)-methylthiotransferase MiaB n=1 Tax=Collinsella sp. An2 TaxID=1965585 RepID=UPI0021006B38|nr:tRNA (N6-isopentenyl adenosine(37)-C2)-methylthiotransferase MiaB [Collinsella sp. An2]
MEQLDIRAALAGKTYFIRTFGCQMNLHDAERVSGLLDSCGCLEASGPEDADIVVFMTCCVREAADQRLYGQCSSMKSLPTPPGGKRVIAVGGCIAQRDGEGLLTNVDNVDVIFGTHSLTHVSELIARAFLDGTRQVLTPEEGEDAATSMPWHRAVSYHAWVPIMTGCNNFCSYCIVPYVRGREKSRSIEEVVDEVQGLVRAGVREVTLLGQNVNSFGRDRYGSPRFAELLRLVGETGIERIRFTSSHPKDLLPETIDAMAEVPAVMPHLHLAVQSGSSRILKEMNRRYTREQYLDLISRIRDRIPGIALSTDIIVGFPGETEEDFLETLSLAQEVGYAQAFTFIYSRREGTPAARIEDPTPRSVIQDRFDRLVKVIEQTAHDFNQQALGRTIPVLVEGVSKKDQHKLQGKSPKNQTVHAPLPEGWTEQDVVGRIVDVKVDTARTWYLSGSVVGEPR